MLELPKPKPKRNVRSGAAHSRLLLRFLPQRLATRLHLSPAKHLVNRSRRRMSQTAENLICRAEGGPKKRLPGHLAQSEANQLIPVSVSVPGGGEGEAELHPSSSNRNWATHVRRTAGHCKDNALTSCWRNND